ncbi:mucin-2-like isoform X2 [Portunus trituberculatus]|uniref:mucin-2-like isoform X2 n=1 Tax=Portunus trituberculatus TaxID=210409 RepID=UPI001E1CD83B|nr:mucin-2-like isoform X2 [Portunus trituberculatus]
MMKVEAGRWVSAALASTRDCTGTHQLRGPSMWLVALLLVTTLPSAYLVRWQHPQKQWCCYGDSIVMDGEVALTAPDCCLQVVCEGGKLVEKRLGQPGDGNCKYSSGNGCLGLDGQLYPPGFVTNQCFPLECKAGQWVPTGYINACCSQCSMYSASHFITYDNHHYDWNGVCNYTLTQQGSTFNPDMGVFIDLETCWGCGACPSKITFRNHPNELLVITTKYLFDILVNGEAFHVPAYGIHRVKTSYGNHDVFAWRRESCLVIVGSSMLSLQICYDRVDVWAHPSLAHSLHGLCGHYNFYIQDDFTDRSGQVLELASWPQESFSLSWRTNTQTDYECNQLYSSTDVCNGKKGPVCHVPESQRSQYRQTCQKEFLAVLNQHSDLYFYIDACVTDLCAVYQSGAGPNQVKELLAKLVALVRIHVQDRQRTIGHDGSQTPTNPDMCIISTLTTISPTPSTVTTHFTLTSNIITTFTSNYVNPDTTLFPLTNPYKSYPSGTFNYYPSPSTISTYVCTTPTSPSTISTSYKFTNPYESVEYTNPYESINYINPYLPHTIIDYGSSDVAQTHHVPTPYYPGSYFKEPTYGPTPYLEPTYGPTPYLEPTYGPTPYLEPTYGPTPYKVGLASSGSPPYLQPTYGPPLYKVDFEPTYGPPLYKVDFEPTYGPPPYLQPTYSLPPYEVDSNSYGPLPPYEVDSNSYGPPPPYVVDSSSYGPPPPYVVDSSSYGPPPPYVVDSSSYGPPPPYVVDSSSYGPPPPYVVDSVAMVHRRPTWSTR